MSEDTLTSIAQDFIKLREEQVVQSEKIFFYCVVDIIKVAAKNVKEVQPGITGIDMGMGQWNFTGEAVWALDEESYDDYTTEEDKLPEKVKAHYLSWAMKGHPDRYYLEGFARNESIEVIAFLLNYLEKKIGFYTAEIVF